MEPLAAMILAAYFFTMESDAFVGKLYVVLSIRFARKSSAVIIVATFIVAIESDVSVATLSVLS